MTNLFFEYRYVGYGPCVVFKPLYNIHGPKFYTKLILDEVNRDVTK